MNRIEYLMRQLCNELYLHNCVTPSVRPSFELGSAFRRIIGSVEPSTWQHQDSEIVLTSINKGKLGLATENGWTGISDKGAILRIKYDVWGNLPVGKLSIHYYVVPFKNVSDVAKATYKQLLKQYELAEMVGMITDWSPYESDVFNQANA